MNHAQRLTVLIVLLAGGCGNFEPVTSAPNPFAITPSRAPSILSPTPLFAAPTASSATLPPPPSLTASVTPDITSTISLTAEVSSTFTLTPTNTETPVHTPTFTSTAQPPILTVLGCDTGLDLSHGMGEVTNAYVLLVNPGRFELTNACLTLSAADEGRAHPDKTICAPWLQSGYQVALRLTVDTTANAVTLIQVALVADQVSQPAASATACPAIGANKPADASLNVPVPIP
ncbi:MAG: hypothetical protein HFACDABA_01280 [Anaerolineales bacterium]|nr:hypothetical protein [Anaerolineales bacterium]